MGQWITDRTQSDVDHVKEITAKARTGTWTKAEQSEWLAGMKGAWRHCRCIRFCSDRLDSRWIYESLRCNTLAF